MEIIVDAYGADEQALGWYYYLEEKLTFPVRARCIAERTISPLRVGDEVEVAGMPPEDECEHDMIVLTQWEGRRLGIPLSMLDSIDVDDQTRQALDDWHYWIGQGYELRD